MYTMRDPVRRAAQLFGDREAVVCGDMRRTYAESGGDGVRHPRPPVGEAVHAVVVSRDGAEVDEAGLIARCGGMIAGCKMPKSIALVGEPLPKSGPGKVLKRVLREPYWEGHDRAIN